MSDADLADRLADALSRLSLPTSHLISTAFLLVGVFALRWLVLRHIRRATGLDIDLRRRWMIQVRNAAFLVLLLGLIIIWGSELRAVALSIVAIAAAVVLALKELIMCLSGAVVRATSDSFEIGDRVEIGTLRGDVFDHTLLTTVLLEVGPGQMTHQHTGRNVVIPNSLLLTQPVINETSANEYVFHSFVVPLRLEDDWRAVEKALLKEARAECAPWLDDARKHIELVGRDRGYEVPAVEPRVTVQLPEPGRIGLVVRVPAPARRKGRVQQAILRRVVSDVFPQATKQGEPGP